MALQVASAPDDLVRIASELLLELTGAGRVEATLAAPDSPALASEADAGGEFPTTLAGRPLALRLRGRQGQRLGELVLHPGPLAFRAEEVAVAVAAGNTVGALLETLAMVEGLQKVAQRKDRFLATLAHELREPLAPVVHGASLLEHAAPGDPLVARARTALGRHADRLAQLLDQVEDIRRIDAHGLGLRRVSCQLAAVVEAGVAPIRSLAAERGVAVRVHLPSHPVLLLADATRLAQALSLLVHQTVACTPAGGTVQLGAAQVRGRVRLTVHDASGGPPAVAADLPAPRPADAEAQCADRDAVEGIGAGLACRLVALHGGTLARRRGVAGDGGAWTVELPCAPKAPVLVPAIGRAAADAGLAAGAGPASPVACPLRVLVVDDNADAADALALLLGRDGHAVTVCYDGEGVAERQAADPHDVVFLDIGLPGVTGYEVARAIRRREGDIPALLVALTGWGQAPDRRRSFESGFDHHLVKPVSYPALQGLLALWARDRTGAATAGVR